MCLKAQFNCTDKKFLSLFLSLQIKYFLYKLQEVFVSPIFSSRSHYQYKTIPCIFQPNNVTHHSSSTVWSPTTALWPVVRLWPPTPRTAVERNHSPAVSVHWERPGWTVHVYLWMSVSVRPTTDSSTAKANLSCLETDVDFGKFCDNISFSADSNFQLITHIIYNYACILHGFTRSIQKFREFFIQLF